MSAICDKCGQEVKLGNDAILIESIANGDGLAVTAAQSRHFLPTNTCEGSPSRAQYISGQPRDSRPGAKYHKHLEKKFRDAYAKAQKL